MSPLWGLFFIIVVPFDTTGLFINMANISENLVIDKYSEGLSAKKIGEIFGVSKTPILRILNKHGLVRKRDRCNQLDIQQDENTYFILKTCNRCKNETKITSTDSTIACRNYFNSISNNSLCKKCSLELQKGKGNPFYGKKHTNKTKTQISENRKGKAIGELNSMSKIENRKKVSTQLKKKWDSGDLDNLRHFLSEKIKQTIRDGKFKGVIKSKAEKIILDQIKNIGYFPYQSYRVDTKICDIFVPELNLIIEYNGDYWHCNPKKYDKDYFNEKKGKYAWELWEYDEKKLELIRNFGYNLEVVWEDDYKSDKTIINNIINRYDTKFKYAPKPSRKD